MSRLPAVAQQSYGAAQDCCGMPPNFVSAPTRKPSPSTRPSQAFRLETVGNERETNIAGKSMACGSRRKAPKAFGSIAASFLSAPAPYGCGKVSGSGKVTYPWPSYLRSSAREDRQRRAKASRHLGCLTITFNRSLQRNDGRAPLDFRHSIPLSLWDPSSPHSPKASSAGLHTSEADARRIARPRRRSSAWPGVSPGGFVMRLRSRLDPIPRAADRRPRLLHAPTNTATRNQNDV